MGTIPNENKPKLLTTFNVCRGNMIKSRYTPYIAGEKNAACPATQTAGLCGKLLVTSFGRRLHNTTFSAVKILSNQVLSI